jgi:predicted P-loop ATPase
MSAAPNVPSIWGTDLTAEDYANFAARWIPKELADKAGLRRVDSHTGQQMFARRRGDFSGLIIPNVAPWNPDDVREFRLRLDNPELEYHSDGSIRESRKYVQPPGRPNLLYFPPGLTVSALEDTNLPLIITEGEFKALALWRLANHKIESLAFAPVATTGVWNFRGTVGKTAGPKGERRDVKGVIPDVERLHVKGRRVIIAYDADAESKPQVRAARWKLSSVLTERGALVGLLEWPVEEGKGIDDRLAIVGPDAVLADIGRVEFGDWSTRLLRNESGRIIPCYENVCLLLENSPEWSGVLGYNEFTAGYTLLREAPPPVTAAVGAEIEDLFDTEVTRWLERRRVMVKPDIVRRVVDGIGRRNPYHPVRDYLQSLAPWDGTPRIGTWLIDYCGVESSDENPNHYAMAVGEKFLISAVARVMEPGCKADHLLILEGAQDIGKSTLVRVLAGDEWFTDQLSDMGSKDAAMQLRGVWILELSELDALNRAEMARAKAFLTQQMERFRLPYGRRIVQVPRQCVFIGTTNADTWLKDETGGRRFWPVRCRHIDLAGLRSDRDQLWAEALHRYREGVKWWLEDPALVKDATEEQRGRYQEDVWQERVEEYATSDDERFSGARANSVSVAEILQRLGIEPAKQDQVAANRVARCLKVAGWERFRIREGGSLRWRYRRSIKK